MGGKHIKKIKDWEKVTKRYRLCCYLNHLLPPIVYAKDFLDGGHNET